MAKEIDKKLNLNHQSTKNIKQDAKKQEMTNTEGPQNPVFKRNLNALFQQDEILAARLWGM